MKQLAEDVYMLKGFPPNAVNVYVVGDVLIDAATRQAEKRIFKQIEGRAIAAHALTHVHPDHLLLDGTTKDKRRDRKCHRIGWQIERVTEIDLLDVGGLVDELVELYEARCSAAA